jgi:hypothetical protein
MRTINLEVRFDRDAYASLCADPGFEVGLPRRIFTIESLRGVYPMAGDLVADLRLARRAWRVQQRCTSSARTGNETVLLLVGQVASTAFPLELGGTHVKLLPDAQIALAAEYAGRGAPPPAGLLLLQAVSGGSQVVVGDVVQDLRITRHSFVVQERLFLWGPSDQLEVHYYLDAGMNASEWIALNSGGTSE